MAVTSALTAVTSPALPVEAVKATGTPVAQMPPVTQGSFGIRTKLATAGGSGTVQAAASARDDWG